MEFSTYIITRNTDKTVVKGTNIVLVLIAGALVASLAGWYKTGTTLFILAVVAGITLAVMKKGNVQAYILSKTKLVITTASIEIAGVVYEMEKIRNLRFVIHSYAGLKYKDKGNMMSQTSDGLQNTLSFTYDGKSIACQFYLNSEKHTFILCQVLQEFYYKKIPFVEADRNGYQTYLLKQLNEKELAAFKEKYGY
ncbi:hypothetical protein [Niastella populi]|uniref:Transmembrane protein n=1 Tax=Niastella populi TaxID=550983 RepID=A0A1V9EKR3_9BACT|nr:hypothetical protein [Niastella populi]OQP46750.1 hypothetical protein A4R26_08550 [Niastella populi]